MTTNKKQISIITIHPQFVEAYTSFGVLHQAQKNNLATISVINLRDYTTDRHKSVDDRPYGGGDGMVMRVDILAKAVEAIINPYVIFASPKGPMFNHQKAQELAFNHDDKHLVFICGRFGGVDQRFIDLYVDEEISLGNYILAGGELPTLSIIEAALRLIPGVLGNPDSPLIDSFSESLEGRMEHPLYTKPQVFKGIEVPPVLLNGDHKAILKWQKERQL